MKLRKLVYYSQAWSLVWDGQPLFLERIEAWDRGPVVRELYNEHARMPIIEKLSRGEPARLSDDQRASIRAVLAFYGKRDEWWLSELTHREPPWLEARARGARNPASKSRPGMTDVVVCGHRKRVRAPQHRVRHLRVRATSSRGTGGASSSSQDPTNKSIHPVLRTGTRSSRQEHQQMSNQLETER